MVIDQLFTFYKKPPQFVYAAESYLQVYKKIKGGYKAGETFTGISIYDGCSRFDELRRDLSAGDTGIILNSAHFIFNIFYFDKIPLKESLKKELIEWRLKKVFPEDLDLYEHHYYSLKRNRILSVLIKKSIKEMVESVFRQGELDLIYLGNSTIEVINKMRREKPSPDFIVEYDPPLTMVVFQEKSTPIYIRKIRSTDDENIIAEVIKTVEFVKTNYHLPMNKFSLISRSNHQAPIKDYLAREKISEIPMPRSEEYFLP